MDAGIVLRSLRQRYVPSQSSEPETQIMARIERSIEIEAAIPVVQDVIWNFARYPEFIPHLEQADTLQTDENTKRVRFTVNILKRLSYTLDLKSTPGKGLVWSLAEGPFQRNEGGWALQLGLSIFAEPDDRNLSILDMDPTTAGNCTAAGTCSAA